MPAKTQAKKVSAKVGTKVAGAKPDPQSAPVARMQHAEEKMQEASRLLDLDRRQDAAACVDEAGRDLDAMEAAPKGTRCYFLRNFSVLLAKLGDTKAASATLERARADGVPEDKTTHELSIGLGECATRSGVKVEQPTWSPAAREKWRGKFEVVEKLINTMLEDEDPPPMEEVECLLDLGILYYSTEGNENCISVPGKGKPPLKGVTIVGDTHGQYGDFVKHIFSSLKARRPTAEWPWLFNGDFVDRGPHGIRIVVALLALKMWDRRAILINRGNHETRVVNSVYGFYSEVLGAYPDGGDALFEKFQTFFNLLPLAHVFNQTVFVCHGGLSESATRIEQFATVQRNCDAPEGAGCDLLWADPVENEGFTPSPRGAAAGFGPDVTARFCEENKIKLVVRSHQVRNEGYDLLHDNKVLTVFSAPNYAGYAGNQGAIAHITFDGKGELTIEYEQFGPYD